jgi:hypothetical protein
MRQHLDETETRTSIIRRKSFLILTVFVGLLCLLGDDPMRVADRRLLELVPEIEAEYQQAGIRGRRSSDIRLTVTVAATGLTVRLFDESGTLVGQTPPVFPPATADLRAPNGSLIQLYIPDGAFPNATVVDIYMGGRLQVRPTIREADKRAAERSSIPFGDLGPLEFVSNRTPQGPVGVTLSYPEGLNPALLNSLKAYFLDEEITNWVPLRSSRVDPASRTVTFSAARFDVFRLMTASAHDLKSVVVYPNPFRPRVARDNVLKFIGLTDDVEVKIYTISGDLVWGRHFRYSGGGVSWDGRNSQGKEVASGLYVYQVTNGDGEKFTGRISVLW